MLHPDIRGNGPCNDCNTVNNIVWFTHNPYWNAVVGDQALILCVVCFAIRAHVKGLHPIAWALIAEQKCPECDRLYWQVDPADTLCPYCALRHAHK